MGGAGEMARGLFFRHAALKRYDTEGVEMEMEVKSCAFRPLLVCLDRWFYRVCVNLCDEHIHSKVFHVCPLNKRTGMSQRIQVIRIGLGLVEQGEAEATFATPIGRWRPT
jgi:hypothetical protein